MADTTPTTPPHAAASLNSILADDKLDFRKALDLYFDAQRADWLVFEKRHRLETPEGRARKKNARLAWSLCIEALRMVRDTEAAHFALREAALELFETNPAFDPDVSSLTTSGLAIRAIKTGHKDLPNDIREMLREAEALTGAFAGNIALMSFRAILQHPSAI